MLMDLKMSKRSAGQERISFALLQRRLVVLTERQMVLMFIVKVELARVGKVAHERKK